MILARGNRSALKKETSSTGDENSLGSFSDYIERRDYTGALTLLEFDTSTGHTIPDGNALWRSYCHFQLAEYGRAAEVYRKLLNDKSKVTQSSDLELFVAICQFYNGEDVDSGFLKSYDGQHRLLAKRFHAYLEMKTTYESQAQGIADSEKGLTELDKLLPMPRSLEDELCIASIHFGRHQYQEAIDIYKKILLESKNYYVLNIYIALCYYKLDYYDVSQEVLALYLQKHPRSIIAGNLRACNNYRLFNGTTAEQELRNLIDAFPANFAYAKDLIRHNLVVFRGGEGAYQVLPLLLHSIPEAKLNLIINYLKNDKMDGAYKLIANDGENSCKLPLEYIVKAIVYTNIGQRDNSQEHLKTAQNLFQLIGSSPSECDTIQGRQCMASYFFLVRQFDEVVLYLSSIKTYFYNDDTFNFNFGQAKMMTHAYREAEEAFLLIENDKIRNDLVYIFSLIRCYIMNIKASKAWDLFLKHQHSKDANLLLHLIANDCYKTGQFFIALRAFDVLEKIDKSPENWEGKRGSAVGVFQLVIAKEIPIDHLHEAMRLLRTSSNSSQANQIINIMRNFTPESN